APPSTRLLTRRTGPIGGQFENRASLKDRLPSSLTLVTLHAFNSKNRPPWEHQQCAIPYRPLRIFPDCCQEVTVLGDLAKKAPWRRSRGRVRNGTRQPFGRGAPDRTANQTL